MTHVELQRDEDTAALKTLWEHGLTGIAVPEDKQWSLWWELHRDFQVICFGLQETCRTFVKRQGMLDADGAIKYASKCMNRFAKDLRQRNRVADFPFHTLSPDLAHAVGLPARMAITPDMFWRCHARLRAIEAGRVPKPMVSALTA